MRMQRDRADVSAAMASRCETTYAGSLPVATNHLRMVAFCAQTFGERSRLQRRTLVAGRVRKAHLQGVVGARIEAKGKVNVTRNHLSLLSHPIRDAHVYRDDTHVPPAAVVSRGLEWGGRDQSGWHISSGPQPCALANNGKLQLLIPANDLTVVGAQRGTSGMPARHFSARYLSARTIPQFKSSGRT